MRKVFAWLAWAAAVTASAGSAIAGGPTAAPADWNEWRGPQRNGLVEASAPLANQWPTEGPKKVWESEEKVPGGDLFGYGSVVVADGRVYCLIAPRRMRAITTRTISSGALQNLGGLAKKPADDLVKAIETARLSNERLAIKDNKALADWVKKWTDANVPAAQKEFLAFARDRLTRGKAALDLALLDALGEIKDKPFANQAALDTWFDDHRVQGDLRKYLLERFPSQVLCWDTQVLCLDATSGKTAWKRTLPGAPQIPGDRAPSSTPCVVGGKCYVLGADSAVFCLDANTGEKVWEARVGKGSRHASPLIINGLLILPAGPLTALDAQTGQVAWTQDKVKVGNASAVVWRKDGKAYVVCRAARVTSLVDAKMGAVVWTVPDGNNEGTPAIVGDEMLIWNQGNLRLFHLTPEKADLRWTVKCEWDYGASPTLFGGYAWAFGSRGAVCVDGATGQVEWQDAKFKTGSYGSPVFADGKIIVQGNKDGGDGYGDGSLFLVSATPTKPEILAKAAIKQMLTTTPAFVDGRLYCRLEGRIACYDLRAAAYPATRPANP